MGSGRSIVQMAYFDGYLPQDHGSARCAGRGSMLFCGQDCLNLHRV